MPAPAYWRTCCRNGASTEQFGPILGLEQGGHLAGAIEPMALGKAELS